MRLFCDSNLGLGTFASSISRGSLAATIVVKAEATLQPDQDALLLDKPPLMSGDVADEEGGIIYPSDFAPLKPRADLLIVGTAHSPNAVPTQALNVRYRMGAYAKSLRVAGDRVWRQGSLGEKSISQAQPFVSMPLTYGKAYGGPGYAANPIGRGYPLPAAPTVAAPNIEHANHAWQGPQDRVPVAGFGAVAAAWESRSKLAGTYDETWLKKNWPWFPDDFDWSYFNCAPRDQQVEGYLRGDEELEFENLHPVHPIYRFALPRLRARCFVNLSRADGKWVFSEVPLQLDTVWINMDEERIVLAWRGVAPAHTLKLRELEQVFAFTEPLSQPVRSLDESWHYVRARFIETEEEAPESPTAAQLRAASRIEFDQAFAQADQELAQAQQEVAQHEAQAEAALQEQHAAMVAQGVDPAVIAAAEQPRTLAQSRAELTALVAQLEQADPAVAAQIQAQLVDLDSVEKEIAAAEQALEPSQETDFGQPKWTRESVLHALATDGKILSRDLSELELAEVDFSHADLSHSTLKGSNLKNAKFIRTRLCGVDFTGADLTDADLSDAVADDADFTAGKLANARYTGASLNGAVFAKLDLRNLDFSNCTGKAADFSHANLTGASFEGATLPQADFSGSKLRRANFAAAQLHAAQFDGAQGQEICMTGADVTGLHGGDKSDFTGGDFRGLQGSGSIWEHATLDAADFSSAILTRAQFSEASLRGTLFDRAHLRTAVFEDAVLEHAVLTNANLLRASFDRANLSGADLRGSNCFEAGFWDAVVYNTHFDHANLKSTLLTQGHGYRTAAEE